MDKYLLEKLKMKENNWLGICKTKSECFIINSEDLITPSVGKLVEITSLAISCICDAIHDDMYPDDPTIYLSSFVSKEVLTYVAFCLNRVTCKPPQSSSCRLKASVSSAEGFSSHFENIPREGNVLELCKYKILRLELIHYQSSVKEEPTAGEADEYWKISLNSSSVGLGELLTSKSTLPPTTDAHIIPAKLQHDNFNVALESWYSGDHVVIFSGEYEAVNLSLLTKDIIIAPYGKPEEPVIVSKPPYESFVVSKAQDTNLTHLRSVQQRTVNGVVAAESGQVTIANCVRRCEGTGVWLTGASLTITGSEITGAQGTGVEQYPRSTAILESYKIHHRTSETSHHSQGGIIKWHRVTILQSTEKSTSAERIVEFTASDDAEEDTHSKLIPDLSLEMNTDTRDDIKDSSVIHSWISKLHVAFGF
ncbi:LOW QUALITY PROTEIN: testicular spindle-associated protein SHCBP1L [Theristicus caerulescens]